MLKTFEIILDIEKDLYNATTQSFAVSQNDLDTVELSFLIQQDNAALDLTGTTIQLAIKKPSSLVVYQDVEIIDAAAGEARVMLNNQAYIEFGIYTAEIYIRDVDSLAVTCPFYYFSRTSVMGDDSIESITEWTDFQAALFNYDKKPLILEGVPNQIPDYIGQTAFDVTDGLVFIANGNTAASWQLIGGGGEGGGIATWDTILGKPDVFPAAPHLHIIADVTGLQDALDSKANVGDVSTAPAAPVDWLDVQNKPDTFPPTAHSHTFAAITAKPDTYPAAPHLHVVADVTGLQAALDGKADDADLAGKANVTHTHTAAAITDFGTAVVAAIPAEYLTETEGDARYAIKGTQPGTTAVAWGDIAGTLANQADLQTALNGKADDADLAGKADVNHSHTFAAITAKPDSYPPSAHAHVVADVTGLQAALDGKADDVDLAAYAPIDHTHVAANITDFGTAVAAAIPAEYLTATEGDAAYSPINHSHTFAAITAKPDTYPAAPHVHAIADVTDLQTALDGKADDGDLAGYAPLSHTHTAANITDFGTAVAANIPAAYMTDTETAAAYQPKGTYLTAVPLMGGNQIGGAMVGNGLAMSGNYLTVKQGASLGVAADNALQVQTTAGAALKFWTGTQAAYNALTKDANTLYFING